ncbi:MAG: hypothetical protein ACYSXD_11190 [Planctomycetota bacterium]|jgi:hypothetical protein
MAKRKGGLHKQVSSIFDGVPIPAGDGEQQSPVNEPTSENPVPAPLKPVAPSHLTAKPSEPEQPEQPVQPPQPKPAAPKQSKIEVVTKDAGPNQLMEIWEKISAKLFAEKEGVDVKKQKMMVVVIPVLFVVLIFVFSKVLRSPSRGVAKLSPAGPSNATAAVDKRQQWQIPEPYPESISDVMQFNEADAVSITRGLVSVKGIVYSEDNPSAVVSNEIVHEGDEISGATVVKIYKDRVEFEMNGKTWTQKVDR